MTVSIFMDKQILKCYCMEIYDQVVIELEVATEIGEPLPVNNSYWRLMRW